MKRILDGLLISLVFPAFYMAALLLAMTLSAPYLASLPPSNGITGTVLWIQSHKNLLLFLCGGIPLVLYLIHNTFFVLFFRRLWFEVNPEMKHVAVNLLCWGTFFAPGLMHLAAASGPAWKRGTKRAKILFIFAGVFALAAWSPIWKFLPLPLLTHLVFYGAIAWVISLYAFYLSVSREKPSRWIKWSSAGFLLSALGMLAWIYGMTLCADFRYSRAASELAAIGAPVNRTQYNRFFLDGVASGNESKEWGELLGKIPEKFPDGLPLPHRRITPEFQAWRDLCLEQIRPTMEKIDSLIFRKIKPEIDPEKPVVNFQIPQINQARRLMNVYSMRMQSALDGEHPDKNAALEDFRRSRELLKFCEPGLIGALAACGIEANRMGALAEMLERTSLSPEECRRLDAELRDDEKLIRASFARNFRMEAFLLPDVADMFLEGEAPGAEKYPFRRMNRVLAAPFYIVLVDTKTFACRSFARFISEVLDSPLDYRQFPKPLPWPKAKEYPNQFLCGMFLPVLDSAVSVEHRILFRIRAVRKLLREKAGLETDSIRDPFADVPLKSMRGTFPGKERLHGETVRGVRIYSFGVNGVDDKGEKDDSVFEFIQGVVQ